LSSAKATLYKINPHTARLAAKPLVVAHSRATRPEIINRGDDLLVRVTGGGGELYGITPSPLGIEGGHGPPEAPGPPRWEEYLGELGPLWWYDQPYGYVSRQENGNVKPKEIEVTRTYAKNGGPCITSFAKAAGSIWVTVAPLSNPPLCR